MAVAVKTSPDARSAGVLANPPILSVIGVVYLLACLAIVFKLIPDLWWAGWDPLGWNRAIGGTLLLILDLAIGVGLVVLGNRLLGPTPPAGVRGGVFLGVVGLLTALLLARWASIWVEHWAPDGSLSPTTGAIICGVVFAVLLLGAVWLLFRPRAQRLAVGLETAGWFGTSSYKANQGLRVRRGTIFGILLLVGAGIYTMLAHGVLRRTNPDWALAIPFTSTVAIESFGDARPFIAGKLTAEDEVEVRYSGASSLRTAHPVPFEKYREAVAAVLQKHDDLGKAFRDLLVEKKQDATPEKIEPTEYMTTLNELIYARLRRVLDDPHALDQLVARELRAVYNQATWEDPSEVLAAFKQKARPAKDAKDPAAAKKHLDDLLNPVLDLPAAVIRMDWYKLRDVKEEEKKWVKIRVAGDPVTIRLRDDPPDAAPKERQLKFGDIVKRDDLETAVAELKKTPGASPPVAADLDEPAGPIRTADITLLPAVQYTLPLLLLVGSLWLAWRIVNLPAFADFLIATEAEMNKVSWTTQKRLIQDTVVVLVTVVLMALFLFGMDWGWKVVLSWKPIGVLHIPPESAQGHKKAEEKKW